VDTLTSLRVFRSVAEMKSFAAAADRLGVSAAMASKHVMHLEERLASRLLNRTSRRVSLTEAGALYLEQAQQLLDGLDEVEAVVSQGTMIPRGTLRMAAPAWFANPAFAKLIAEFCALYPEVRFEIDLSGRPLNLIDQGFDLAIKATPPDALDPGLIARRLAEIEFHLVAAPAHLDKAGRPQSLSDLQGRPFLLYSGTRSDGAFPLEGPQGTETVKFDVVLESGNETMLRQLAIEGMGLTFAPKWTLGPDLAAGRLELVLPGTLHTAGLLYAVYPSRRFLSAKVRAFIDFLTQESRIVFCPDQITIS
jgi:DNA-binding transcriptional LysR family regulator